MKRLAAWLLLLALNFYPAIGSAQQQPANKAEIESIVRSYLLEHPEILIEMSRILQTRQSAQKQDKAKAALAAHRDDLFGDGASLAAGAPADHPDTTTIVEFFDYRCGYCKRVVPVLQKLLAGDRTLRIVYKEFPILGPESKKAAAAALAAAKQNQYVPFHDALMKATSFSDENLANLAKTAGLDVDQWKKDMQSPEIQATIENTYALASALGIEATPAFVIGDEIVQGAMDENAFKSLITKARSKAADQ